MPEAINPGTGAVQEVSQGQYDRSWDTPGDGRTAFMVQDEERFQVRLYDVVDGTWTQPLDRGQVYGKYLLKKVAKCTACTYTDPRSEELVWSHIGQVHESARDHEHAELIESKEDGQRVVQCTACSTTFVSYKIQRANEHILRMRMAGPQHDGAAVQVINRFSLAPVELPPAPTTDVGNGHQSGRPEASPVEGTVPLLKRKRKRHRNRKAKHDNGG